MFDYFDFIKTNLYKLPLPLQTLFKFDKNRYQNKKEFFTIITVDALLSLVSLDMLYLLYSVL